MVAPLPEGWKAYRDPATNGIYYAAPDGKTQWQAPPPPAPTQEMPSLGQAAAVGMTHKQQGDLIAALQALAQQAQQPVQLAQQVDALGRQVQALCSQVERLSRQVDGVSKQVANAEGGRSDAGPSKPVKRERSENQPRAPDHAEGGRSDAGPSKPVKRERSENQPRAPDHAEGGRSDAGPSKPVKRERSEDEPRAPEHQPRAQGGAQCERRDGEPSEPIGESVEASDMRLARVMHDKDIHADLRQERKRPRRYGYDE